MGLANLDVTTHFGQSMGCRSALSARDASGTVDAALHHSFGTAACPCKGEGSSRLKINTRKAVTSRHFHGHGTVPTVLAVQIDISALTFS